MRKQDKIVSNPLSFSLISSFSLCRLVNLVLLAADLLALLGPREVGDGDDEEAVEEIQSAFVQLHVRTQEFGLDNAACHLRCNNVNHGTGATYLFEVSAIPARALYQAKKAAARAKAPPAVMQLPLPDWRR